MPESRIEITAVESLDEIGKRAWDACACPEVADGGRPRDPFTTYRFLRALEESRSVGTGTGWRPCHLAASMDGETFAVAPLYVKSHSQGEYIFDHGWAHAYERAGGSYYPKLQMAVPFTPATGRRFLVKPGFEETGMGTLVEGAVRLAAENGVSSVHVTFCTETEAAGGEKMGLLRRVSDQFHWENRDYSDFDDFLAGLSSRKRKNIRKERTTAQRFGGRIRRLTGADLRPDHWDAFWRFYIDTGGRKWGAPYLTREFFEAVHETMRDDALLVLAERDGRPVAGALNFIGRETLYGRYWGCLEDHPCLHFELCYYQANDFAISEGLARVEAGAQGGHKLARGYLPVECHSLHWIAEPRFRDAVDQYLRAERDAVGRDIEVMTGIGPFRKAMSVEE